MNESVLSIRKLTKRFDVRRVLRGVDLTLHAGQTLLLLGANGAGKTTLLSIIAGRARASSGSVEVLSEAISAQRASHKIGSVGHSVMLHPGLSVGENLTWFAAALGVSDPKQRARDLLERFGATHLAKRETGKLSRGEGQRVALARAMLADPPLLLLDEPFTGLDEAGRMGLIDEIMGLREAGKAVLLTTHETDLGASLATDVAWLVRGVIDAVEASEHAQGEGGVIERYRRGLRMRSEERV